MTATELRVTLPGPEGSVDAARALKILEHVLELLGRLEDHAASARAVKPGKRATWGFTDLHLGSVAVALAPEAASDLLDDVARRLIHGFDQAEREVGVPDPWDIATATTAADLARMLDFTDMTLELIRDHTSVGCVTVTTLANEHLRQALKRKETSIGSVIGRLESFSVRGGREAGLWPHRGGPKVTVRFDRKDQQQIIAALDRYVEISGRLERDAAGRPVAIKMRHIEILPVSDRPLTSLVGLDPDFTDGLSTGDYLREIRGAA